MFKGQHFSLIQRGEFIELVLDSQKDHMNTLSESALTELETCIEQLESNTPAGLIFHSTKTVFSAGANIKEFEGIFDGGENAIDRYLAWSQGILNRLEDLDTPKVAVINNFAAGGAVELSLLAEYRIATPKAKLLLPEVKLGIMPCWGGVTRLPRIAGLDTAIQWITTGKQFKAEQALEHHVIDGVINPKTTCLLEQAEKILQSCLNGDLDWRQRQEEKRSPLPMNDHEVSMSITVAKGMAAKVAGPNYPAPNVILNTMFKSAKLGRDEALSLERAGVVKCVESGVAGALVNVYVSDLNVKSKAKSTAKSAQSIDEVGVIGAGIMGGGIAYVTADKNIDVVMKDINKQGLALGLAEANKLLSKQVERGRKKPAAMGEVLNRITPTLHNISLEKNSLVIEAVVENPIIKEKVLTELEQVAPNAVIASNTSTLMISGLAHALKHPENFCGIHFFNPVHKMPLVEVIRGEKTSDETIATAVSYVLSLGKTPIVVNDCAGFLVNRCLTPYFLAFNQLVVDGGDLTTIDKVMSKSFGWPMGPGLLLDVIGLDTASHCIDVMNEAFGERLATPKVNLIQKFVDNGKLGQKSHCGFYAHEADRRGRIKPVASESSNALLAEHVNAPQSLTSEDIQMRMMLPMMFEAIRCLDEGIIASAAEGDIAFVYGTGFPPFRGGLFYYMDQFGLDNLLTVAEKYQHLGELYKVPKGLTERATKNQAFYA
ncbi:fatty acid oxidation complex subunit alpha FadB [Vibrio kyushuensis]|uniref:fatty acid oxidation complex subunit alpha FadB n=1 Tax=Vibrio kyushuensis TaxID=2910249 RepID=UPI003D12A533